jgi:hypothetical protein
MKLEINLNETVEVVLTKEGAEIYNDRWYPLVQRYNLAVKEYKAGDTLRTQLWSLMQDFGPHIQLGAKAPFEGLVMSIVKDVS